MTRQKYNNKPVIIDGINFDSRAEADRYAILKLMQQAGEIRDLVVHPRYCLQEAVTYQRWKERALYYEADFSYWLGEIMIIEDVKGYRTDAYKIKRKLFLNFLKCGGIQTSRGTTYPVFEEVEL